MIVESHQCDQNRSRLVVVDIQERLGAVMPAKVLNRVVQNTSLLAFSAGLMNVPVLLTEQYPQGLGTTNADISKALPKDSKTFTKTSFSACGADGFMDAVSSDDRNQIIISGMEAHVCVLQTALDLHASGFQVFVVEDGICSRRLENYENALARLRQVGVELISAESVLFEWFRDSRHEHFKTIQALLR